MRNLNMLELSRMNIRRNVVTGARGTKGSSGRQGRAQQANDEMDLAARGDRGLGPGGLRRCDQGLLAVRWHCVLEYCDQHLAIQRRGGAGAKPEECSTGGAG